MDRCSSQAACSSFVMAPAAFIAFVIITFVFSQASFASLVFQRSCSIGVTLEYRQHDGPQTGIR